MALYKVEMDGKRVALPPDGLKQTHDIGVAIDEAKKKGGTVYEILHRGRCSEIRIFKKPKRESVLARSGRKNPKNKKG